MRHLLLLCLIVGLLCSCTRGSLQFRIGEDGSFKKVSPESVREDYQLALASRVAKHIGSDWMVQVDIAQLPYYETSEESFGGQENWHWEHIDVLVHIVGQDDMDATSVDREEVEDIIRGQLLRKRTGRLTVTSNVVCDGIAYAALQSETAPQEGDEELPAKVSKTDETTGDRSAGEETPAEEAAAEELPADGAHGSTPPADGQRRYVIQEGDTLALISSVFYGKADDWRRIADANPDLDPGRPLPVGSEIVIP